MGLMFFQDPLLNYFNTWCTYNTWLFNRDPWSSDIPGWVSPEEPGRQVAEPLLTNAPGYAYGVLLITIAGCWGHAQDQGQMAWYQQSSVDRCHLRNRIRLRFCDGGWLVMPPIGFYTYPGSIRAVSFNAGTYYQWPIYEGLMWGGVMTALCLFCATSPTTGAA